MARKDRIPVVFDTNLFVARLLRRKKSSLNQRVFNLWAAFHFWRAGRYMADGLKRAMEASS